MGQVYAREAPLPDICRSRNVGGVNEEHQAPKQRSLGLRWAGAAVVGVLVAAGLLWWLLPRPQSAGDAALELFHALAAGDATRVTGAGAPLTDAVRDAFAEADERISDPVLLKADVSDQVATVEIGYHLGDDEHSSTLTLHRDGQGWTVAEDTVFGSVRASAPWSTDAAIGEVPLPLDEEVVLLPAIYPLRAGPAELFIETAVAVTAGGAQEVTLSPDLQGGALTLLQQQLDDYLDLCTAGGGSVPAQCGIRIPWAADIASLTQITYRVESYPVIALDLPGFRGQGGVLMATARGTGHDGQQKVVTYRTDQWGVRGDVEISADTLILAVW